MAAWAHREHRRRAAPVEDRYFTVTVVPTTAVAATGVCAKEEAGEEDGRDDEDEACHDADPCGNESDPATSRLTFDIGRGVWWGRGSHRAGRGFGSCFAHVSDDASDADVCVMNYL